MTETTSPPRLPVVVLLALFACGCATDKGWDASDWPADARSTLRIDHDPWQQILNRYLVPAYGDVNRVDYANLAASGLPALTAYLNSMSQVDLTMLSRDEQMAYWINVYNALTFRVIAESWPVDSILSLDDGNGPWDRIIFRSGGRALSLNDIEHRLLRKLWREPRIHFAVNCASYGCPDVQPIAYTADNLDSMLGLAARNFLSHPRAARLEGDTLHLSSLFVWYSKDFAQTAGTLHEALAGMADEVTATMLRQTHKRVEHDYDWGLNGID